MALEQFEQPWEVKYLSISHLWRSNWQNISTTLYYLRDIQKVIYSTNAIESFNSVIRKAIKKRKLFPQDDSAKKVIYLATLQAFKKIDDANKK